MVELHLYGSLVGAVVHSLFLVGQLNLNPENLNGWQHSINLIMSPVFSPIHRVMLILKRIPIITFGFKCPKKDDLAKNGMTFEMTKHNDTKKKKSYAGKRLIIKFHVIHIFLILMN